MTTNKFYIHEHVNDSNPIYELKFDISYEPNDPMVVMMVQDLWKVYKKESYDNISITFHKNEWKKVRKIIKVLLKYNYICVEC